jgi:cytochrome c oxidase subunit 3
MLAMQFTFFQFQEYFDAGFNISDSVYGSIFFVATGFHGFHVILGTCFLLICFLRISNGHFGIRHHLGLEFAI